MVSPKIKLNFTPFLRRIYVVSCNPAHISCGCFAVPLWIRRWLLFQQNNGEQYSDTTDSRPIHHRQSIATYQPRCRPSADRQSAGMSTEYRPICQPTYRSVLGRHIGWDCRPTEVFITHDRMIIAVVRKQDPKISGLDWFWTLTSTSWAIKPTGNRSFSLARQEQ